MQMYMNKKMDLVNYFITIKIEFLFNWIYKLN